MEKKIKVTVFGEHNQDRFEPVKSVYPNGIHGAIAEGFLEDPCFEVRTVTQDMPEHGLTEEVLADTDVLVWWSHLDNPQFDNAVADRVCYHVVCRGMGFIALHSSLFSKPWQKMLGIFYDAGAWGRFRTMPKGEKARVWVIQPGHPITYGVRDCIEIPQDEMYGEPQLIPEPDQTVFLTWWEGGEACRGGCVYYRGRGKLFQFTPGHETFPIFYQPEIRLVLRNAAKWMAPSPRMEVPARTEEHLNSNPREDLSHRM